MRLDTEEFEHHYQPSARQENLIVKRLDDATLVYDKSNHKALCLNATAALLWHNCDGGADINQLAGRLSHQLGSTVDEEFIWYGLKQLSRQNLLCERPGKSAVNGALSRRLMLRRTGIAAAVTLPLISAIVAPMAVHAATLGASGAPCNTGLDCSSGTCNGGVCA